MKTFALSLLASYALGSKFLNIDQDFIIDEGDLLIDDGDSFIIEDPLPTGLDLLDISQTIDLRRSTVDSNGYMVAPGETLEFILHENSSTPFEWKYDATIIDQLFNVQSKYQQGKWRGFGTPGARHFLVTAGQEGGNGMLFACETPVWDEEEVSYHVMAGDRDCMEININVVVPDHGLNEQITSLVNELETYNLQNDADVDDLELKMEDLAVGETLKIQVANNPSVGYFYELQTEQDNLFEIVGPTHVSAGERSGEIRLGATGTNEYTLTVVGAGDGQIQFVPYSSRSNPPTHITYYPQYAFDFSSHQ